MIQPKFIDGIGHVRLSGGMVRIDLLAQATGAETKEGQPGAMLVDQLVLSPEGFSRFFNSLAATVRNMEEKGLLKHGGKGTEANTNPAESPGGAAG